VRFRHCARHVRGLFRRLFSPPPDIMAVSRRSFPCEIL
jgi:hypothetical protein